MAENGAYEARECVLPVRGLDFGTVVRLPDGRLGWLYKGKGRNPYRVTCGDCVVNVQSDDRLEVVMWPAQTAAAWIASATAQASTPSDGFGDRHPLASAAARVARFDAATYEVCYDHRPGCGCTTDDASRQTASSADEQASS